VAITVGVYIDWDGDDTYDETGEDVSARWRHHPGIKTQRGRDQIRALSPPMAGAVDFELDNQSRDYSPENGTSPLVGLLDGGQAVRVTVTDGTTVYRLATGKLEELIQYADRTRKSVGVRGIGSLGRLKGVDVSTLLYAGITTGTAMHYLLDAIGWPAAKRDIQQGKTTLEWWWLDGEDAFEAACTLLNTEGPGAGLYESGSGYVVFEDRHYRLMTARSNTAQGTVSLTGYPRHSPPFGYTSSGQDVINECSVSVSHRSEKTDGTILYGGAGYYSVWTYEEQLTLAPNEVLVIPVSLSDPCTEVWRPNPASGDVQFLAGTATLRVGGTHLSTSGSRTTLTITAGAAGAMIERGMRMTGLPVTEDWTKDITNTVSGTASIAKYGRRSYSLEIRPEINPNTALDFCNAVVTWYQVPVPQISVTLINAFPDRLEQQLKREISDRLHIEETQTGLNADCWVEQITQELAAGGALFQTTFGCSKVPSLDYGVYGVSVYGTGVYGW